MMPSQKSRLTRYKGPISHILNVRQVEQLSKSIWEILNIVLSLCGPGYLSRYSDSLRNGRSWDRIAVGTKSPVPFQTEPGAHPAFYTMGTASLSQG